MIGNITKTALIGFAGNMMLHNFMPQYGVDIAKFLPDHAVSQANMQAANNQPVIATAVETGNPLSSLVSSALQIIPTALGQGAHGSMGAPANMNAQSTASVQPAAFYSGGEHPKWYW